MQLLTVREDKKKYTLVQLLAEIHIVNKDFFYFVCEIGENVRIRKTIKTCQTKLKTDTMIFDNIRDV